MLDRYSITSIGYRFQYPLRISFAIALPFQDLTPCTVSQAVHLAVEAPLTLSLVTER